MYIAVELITFLSHVKHYAQTKQFSNFPCLHSSHNNHLIKCVAANFMRPWLADCVTCVFALLVTLAKLKKKDAEKHILKSRASQTGPLKFVPSLPSLNARALNLSEVSKYMYPFESCWGQMRRIKLRARKTHIAYAAHCPVASSMHSI